MIFPTGTPIFGSICAHGCRSIGGSPLTFRHPYCCSPHRPHSALGMSLRPGDPRGRVRAYVRELIRAANGDDEARYDDEYDEFYDEDGEWIGGDY